MTGTSHAVVGLSCYLLAVHELNLLPATPTFANTQQYALLLAGAGLSVLGAYLPDIDNVRSTATHRIWGRGLLNRLFGGTFRRLVGGHRAGTHSLWAALLLIGSYFIFTPIIIDGYLFPPSWRGLWPAGAVAWLGFIIGYISHILADMPTPDGVQILWPLSKRCYHILPRGLRFRSGSWTEYIVVALLVAFMIWRWAWWV